jgi:hypothetical protein
MAPLIHEAAQAGTESTKHRPRATEAFDKKINDRFIVSVVLGKKT